MSRAAKAGIERNAMQPQHVIWVTGPSAAGCDALKRMLEPQPDLDVRTHALRDGHLDMQGLAAAAPRLVLLDLGNVGEPLLREWAALPEGPHVPLIVVGPATDSTLMRRAMQSGARDFFTHPVPADELLASLRQVLRESREARATAPGGRLTAVIDAKGGSGGSFIACNLAHILAAQRERKTALIDLDLQFGALPLALDLHPRATLFDAIGNADQIDPLALKAYMTEHASGLHVLGTMAEQLVMPWEVSVEALQKVLQVALQGYAHVVVDLPRQIDPLTGMVLGGADRVLVVMQQSFAHLRDAQRLFSLLRNHLGVPSDRITLLVNRYDDKAPISGDDIREAVRPAEFVTIPNDFEHVSESLNVGVPLYQGARNAAVTRALSAVAERLDTPANGERASAPQRRGLARVFGLRR
jgi:pilus assembly protein CpaE